MKWQSVAAIFITIILGTGGLLTYTDLFGGLFLLTGVTYSHSGDSQLFIEEDVLQGKAFVDVNTTYWNICFEHSDRDKVLYAKVSTSRTRWVNLNLVDQIIITEPRVPVKWQVPTYGNKWRDIKDGDCWVRGKVNRNKLIGYPENNEVIKWSFILGDEIDVDPLWLPIPIPTDDVKITSVSLLDKQTGYWNYWNTTKDVYVFVPICGTYYENNKTYAGCWKVDYVEITEHEEYIVTKEWQEVLVNNKPMDVTVLDWWCYEDKSCTICEDMAHGDGDMKIKGITPGTSYCISCDGGKFECSGYHKEMIPAKVKEVLK